MTASLDNLTVYIDTTATHSGKDITHSHTSGKLLILTLVWQTINNSDDPVATVTYDSASPDETFSYLSGATTGHKKVYWMIWHNASSGSNTFSISSDISVRWQVGGVWTVSSFNSSDPVGDFDANSPGAFSTECSADMVTEADDALILFCGVSRGNDIGSFTFDSPLSENTQGVQPDSTGGTAYAFGNASQASSGAATYGGDWVGTDWSSGSALEIKPSSTTVEDEGLVEMW